MKYGDFCRNVDIYDFWVLSEDAGMSALHSNYIIKKIDDFFLDGFIHISLPNPSL